LTIFIGIAQGAAVTPVCLPCFSI